MTLAVAWLRKFDGIDELVVATDSLLTGSGSHLHAAPKIVTFARGDCVMCFAGSTAYAYPALQQIRTFIEASPRARIRAMDLNDLRGRVIDVLNQLRTYIDNRAVGLSEAEDLDTRFILAGYSSQNRRFEIWSLFFDPSVGQFRYDSYPSRSVLPYLAVGDGLADFRQRLRDLHFRQRTGPLDMKPFEVLRDICRDASPETASIGGAPQLVKVYRHSNTMSYCVYWSYRGQRTLTYLGRPLMHYETMMYRRIDPDTLEMTDGYEYTPK